MRVRSSRIISYATGWAVLTVLAAGVVWWGFRPLLAPIMQSAPVPPQPSAPAASPTAQISVSPTPAASKAPPRRNPSPRPSMFEGWQVIDGGFVQTFELDGGTATVRIVDGRVELVSSQPAAGYTVTPRQPSPQRLVVEFFNGTRYFVLDALWWEGKPHAKVTEVS